MKMPKITLMPSVGAIGIALAALTSFADYQTPYRGLPAGYTQVEYIQSSGSQYIDLGINAQSGLAMETVMSWGTVPGDATFCGARTSSERVYLLHYYGSWTLGHGNYFTTGKKAAAEKIYHVESDVCNGLQKVTVADESGNVELDWSKSPAATGDIDIQTTLTLFGYNQGGSVYGKCSARCYMLKIWSVDGEGERKLIGDFVPCLNSSGAAGLYDLVSNKYLPPSAALAGYGNPVQVPVDPSRYDGNVFIGETLEGNWFEPDNWSYGHVPTASEDAFIVSRGVAAAEQITAKSLRIVGGTLKLGDAENRTRFTDNIAAVISGDLTVESNGCLTVYAGRLADEKLADLAHVDTTAYAALYAGATLVTVGGKLTVASGATLLPDCDPLTGTAVFFRPKDFEMDETVSVDVTRRGWRWYKTPEGVAPVGVRYEKETAMYHTYAFGPGYSYRSQGGGYGSDAYNAANAAANTYTNIVDGVVYGEIYRRGGAYGSAYAPFLPGSQGGIQNDTTMPNCRAPGAFVVQATGTAAVKGSILAYGQRDSDWSHSSGGSIWIAAAELKVAQSAVFDVHGGETVNNGRRPGAAGRVALMSGAGSAADLAALAGTTSLLDGYEAVTRRIPGSVNVNGGLMMGAISSDHSTWQNPALGSAVVVVPAGGSAEDVVLSEPEVARDPVAKTWVGGDGYWNCPSNWMPNGVPATNDDVTVASGVCRAPNGVEVGSLSVAAGARLEAFSTYHTDGDRSWVWTTALSPLRPFIVNGDASIAGTVTIGGVYTNIADAVTDVVYRVGGDLTVSGSGRLMVTAAATTGPLTTSNDVFVAKTDFTVGGTFAVRDTAKVTPVADCYGGLPIRFRVGAFELDEGATVDAVNRGYHWLPLQDDDRARYKHTMERYNTGTKWMTMSFDIGYGYTVGSGHGANSPNATATRGLAYGNPYAPYLCGALGGLYTWHYNDCGGVVWIVSDTTATVNGLVDASGKSMGGYILGSGGSIWLSAMEGATFGGSAKLQARGSCGGYYGSGLASGAGGRVAITSGVTIEQLDQIAAGVDPASFGITVRDEVVNVAVDVRSHEDWPNGTGTAVTLTGVTEKKEVTVVAVGAAARMPEPAYGSALYPSGEHTFTAPEYGMDPDPAVMRRYPLVGYVVSNATEEVARGFTGSATIDVRENLALYWIWDVPTRERAIDVDGVRTWVKVGDSFTARATVPEGHEFLYWAGNVPRGMATNGVFTMTVKDRAYGFGSVTRPVQDGVAVRRWKEYADGSWTDPERWEGGVIPGRYDPVVLPYSRTITASNFVMCGSITWSASTAALTILTAGDDVFEEVGLVVTGNVSATGNITVGSKSQTLACPVISVGGDFVMTNWTMTVCAAAVDDGLSFASGAGFITVGGTFELAGNATFKPQSDPYTGGSVKTVCDTFVLLENAKVDASALGFAADRNRKPYSLALGMGEFYDIGAGYGGHGGNADGTYGSEYGFANSPVHPGSNSGVYQTYAPNAGGGLVRIHARNMDVRGSVKADAEAIGGQIVAASGGGIWLTAAESLALGENVVLQAKGSAGYGGNAGGAGGRIAIGWKLSPAQIEALAETGTYPGLRKGRFRTEDWFVERFGLVNRPSVAPGCVGSNPEKSAQKGSFVFIDPTLPGLLLMVR